MAKRYRYILMAALIAAVTIGGYGCMMKYEYRDPFAGAIAYMEQKYGEKFEYVKTHKGHMFSTDFGILMSCESFPDDLIFVAVMKEDNNEIYLDNYMEYYFAGQVKEWITGIAKDYFADVSFKVRISITVESITEMDLTTTFEEYISRERYFVRGHMDIGETDEATIREFAAELFRRKIQFSIGIDIPSANEGYSIRYFDDVDEEIYFYRRK